MVGTLALTLADFRLCEGGARLQGGGDGKPGITVFTLCSGKILCQIADFSSDACEMKFASGQSVDIALHTAQHNVFARGTCLQP